MAKTNSPKKQPKNTDPDDDDDDQEGSGDDDAEAKLNDRINSIVTNRLKRWGDKLNKQIEDTLSKALAGAKPPEGDGDQEGDQDDQPAEGKRKSKTDPKLSKLERELAETRKKLTDADEARKQADTEAQRREERGILEQSLTEAGLQDKTLRSAALAMLLSEGRMVRDEDGKVKWKGQDKYGQDTLIDPALAAKTWAKSDGKAFLPAVDAGGSGGSGAGNGKMPKADFSKMSDAQKAAEEIRRATLGLPALE